MMTFGCKVAQHDGLALAGFLASRGWTSDDEPNLIVVNGCAVTGVAESKALKQVRAVKRRFPDAKILIYGCLAKKLADFGGTHVADYLVEPEEFAAIEAILDKLSPSEHAPIQCEPVESDENIRRTRALVKIHDGCNQYCSYCIVPFLRGDERSKTPAGIIDRIARLAASGVFEVVLTGIHIGRYNASGLNLAGLLDRILKSTSIQQIRLSSIEPNEFTDGLIELISKEPRIARYFHIPLQTGANKILARMRRPYTASDVATLIDKLHRNFPDAGIGIDVIAGFPGESVEDFDDTRRLIEKLPLTNMHVFPFSPRPHTDAADYPDKVPQSEIRQRVETLRQIRTAKKTRFLESYIGKPQSYLIERFDNRINQFTGTSSNYIQCRTSCPDLQTGAPQILTGVEIDGEYLICK